MNSGRFYNIDVGAVKREQVRKEMEKAKELDVGKDEERKPQQVKVHTGGGKS